MSKISPYIKGDPPLVNFFGRAVTLPKLSIKSIHRNEDAIGGAGAPPKEHRPDSPRPTYTEVEYLTPEDAIGGAGAPPKLFGFRSPKPSLRSSAVFSDYDLTESDDETMPRKLYLEASAESDDSDAHSPAVRKVSLSFLGKSDEDVLKDQPCYSGTLSLGSLPSDEN